MLYLWLNDIHRVNMITQPELKSVLTYNPETGIFRWNKPRVGCSPDLIAGSRQKNGYIAICIDQTKYYAHRLAWLYMTGNFPAKMIDHINGSRTDNKYSNLRECNMAQNACNSGKKHNNKSGYKGVSQNNGGKWYARCRANGKVNKLGYFDTAEEAAKAYIDFAKSVHGEFFNSGVSNVS